MLACDFGGFCGVLRSKRFPFSVPKISLEFLPKLGRNMILWRVGGMHVRPELLSAKGDLVLVQ
jgi:hypothetical protein